MSRIFCRLKAFLPITLSKGTLHLVVSMMLLVPLIAWTSSAAHSVPMSYAQGSTIRQKREEPGKHCLQQTEHCIT